MSKMLPEPAEVFMPATAWSMQVPLAGVQALFPLESILQFIWLMLESFFDSLAIFQVGLLAVNRFVVFWVDEQQLQPLPLQYIPHRHPINARGFRGNGTHLSLAQSVCEFA